MECKYMNESLLVAPALAGAAGLVVALGLYLRVKAQPTGNETMNRIAAYVREGSMAFLVREYKVLAVYAAVVAVALAWGFGYSCRCFIFSG
jgi:K(+)-stimulated pyrophosphate-energized sodium pump